VRERERETGRERQGERDRERETGRERDRERERERFKYGLRSVYISYTKKKHSVRRKFFSTANWT
jgi:hypothetical protein